ncbi:hypothetical protein [Pyruvatibacter sp.]|uniref:hypothetical protein n=1 Tax=Pyruvatibacter sp. TaxID=1981328 RepID=UPI0032ED736B
MGNMVPAVFAGLFLGAGIYAVMQIRMSSVAGQIFWLVGLLSFAAAGLFACLRLFLPVVEPVYVTVMLFCISVGMGTILIGAVSHLVRPVPERWATVGLAIPVVVYIVAVLTDQIHFAALVQIVVLIGMTGLAAWKFEDFPRASIWLIAAALSFALLPALLMRIAPGLGLSRTDVGHLALAIGLLSLVQVINARGAASSKGS